MSATQRATQRETDPTTRPIAIVGGHGQIARHLTRRLIERGFPVGALIRASNQIDDVRFDGAEAALVDLEAADAADLDAALEGSDVVVFAAGAGPGSGPDRKKSVDRDGAIRSVESAIRVGARRFVIISSMGADDPPDDDEDFTIYLHAKHDADVAVRKASDGSLVTYTIVRPGRLTDDDPTGSLQLAERAERAEIPRADVAELLAELIASGSGNDVTFEVVSGSTGIADAVHALD